MKEIEKRRRHPLIGIWDTNPIVDHVAYGNLEVMINYSTLTVAMYDSVDGYICTIPLKPDVLKVVAGKDVMWTMTADAIRYRSIHVGIGVSGERRLPARDPVGICSLSGTRVALLNYIGGGRYGLQVTGPCGDYNFLEINGLPQLVNAKISMHGVDDVIAITAQCSNPEGSMALVVARNSKGAWKVVTNKLSPPGADHGWGAGVVVVNGEVYITANEAAVRRIYPTFDSSRDSKVLAGDSGVPILDLTVANGNALTLSSCGMAFSVISGQYIRKFQPVK